MNQEKNQELKEVKPGVWTREIAPGRPPSEEFVKGVINLAGGEQTIFAKTIRETLKKTRVTLR